MVLHQEQSKLGSMSDSTMDASCSTQSDCGFRFASHSLSGEQLDQIEVFVIDMVHIF